jgi:hypothetical protein
MIATCATLQNWKTKNIAEYVYAYQGYFLKESYVEKLLIFSSKKSTKLVRFTLEKQKFPNFWF